MRQQTAKIHAVRQQTAKMHAETTASKDTRCETTDRKDTLGGSTMTLKYSQHQAQIIMTSEQQRSLSQLKHVGCASQTRL